MAINNDIWGDPETWETPAGTIATNAAIKLPVFGNNATYKNTIAGAFDENVFTWNDEIIDKSFSPWGIGKSGAVANPKWLYIAAEVGATYDAISTVNIYTRPQLKTDANRPFMPVWRNSSPANVTEMFSRFDYQYTPNAGAYSTYKNNQRTSPILSFKYNNIIVVPWIECAKIDNNQASGYSYQRYSVDDYFDNHKTEYPYITSVYIKGYYFGDRPDVQTARTQDMSDFNNNRSTICNYFSDEVAGYPASWDGNPTKYRLSSYNVTPYTYTVICGKSPLSQTALLFSVLRNQEYRADDTAFARWTYQSTTYAHGVRGDMFDYDYRYNNGTVYVTPRWADATKADILREVAYLGFWFTCDTTKAQNAAIGRYCTDNDVYIPVFDENGVTTGEYKSGTEAAAIAPADDATPADFIDYDPNAGGVVPDGDSGDLTNRGLYTNRFSNPAYTVWAFYGTSLSNNGLDAAISAINNLYITDPDGNSKWTLYFKGSNPSDYIVGLYAFPLALPTTESSYVFKLGAVEFDTINVKKYAGDGYFDFGSIDLTGNAPDIQFYGDFRDYPPYSTAELYVPFCGTTDIDLAFFIGHTMSIIMYYDIYTGACSAAVYRDNITLYKVLNGQIGVQLPLTSVRAGDYQNNIHALENALKQNDIRLATSALALGLSAGAAVATGGASLAVGAGLVTGTAGMLGTLNERENIEYKLEHTQPTPAQTGASETQNGYRVGGNKAKLFIKRAQLLTTYSAAEYAHTVGHACVINTTIGGQVTEGKNSLIVCSNADLSGIPATAAEISAIQSLLTGGIYV